MTNRAIGTFEVKLTPQKPDNPDAESANVGRMSINKSFHGDIEASSTGEMLAAQTETKGSAGYVAIERVNGTLHGRNGAFLLQHSGKMDRGAPTLLISVIPDSGTGDLAGISGSMSINIEAGKHSYDFEYSLPGAA
jgi:hypothetical protein